ncbi:MAG: hypothetical protein QXU18_12435, partial [Thermoplasmatales archaeon]
DDEIKKAIKDERTAQRGEDGKDRYSYYSQFPMICEALGIDKENWNHIDVLPFRERNQNMLLKDFQLDKKNFSHLLKTDRDLGELLVECLKISFSFMEFLRPKIVVVVNGFLSRKIIEQTGYCYSDNRKETKNEDNLTSDFFPRLYFSKTTECCHRYIEIQNKYPIVLTSMLTGQRALDLASRERLICEIKQLHHEID